MRFRDRSEAGRLLAEALKDRVEPPCVVLALPRGGVPVGLEIARALGCPLDLVMVRKIGAPGQPELALGAVANGEHPVLVVNEDVRRMTGASDAYLQSRKEKELAEIARRKARYLAGRAPAPVEGRTAIVVDDGIATGATMLAALRAVRRKGPKKVILAVPVAPPDSLARLSGEADETVCLHTSEWFMAVGQFYDDFRQIDDEEVVAALAEAAPED
ncbi:Putative phosphoribosyl transferase [bacterium HR39]|nr:Putative phosphoribosyl transferase [bacterium HR39]